MSTPSSNVLLSQTRFERRTIARDVLLVVGFSLLVALSARVAIPVPGTPVPITGQTLAVLLAGALLGAARGFLVLALYLLEGAMGLPVFAEGRFGAAVLLAAPSAGYLWGFPLAAALVGWLAERGWDRRPATTALAMLLGNGVIYLCGVTWLAFFVGTGNALAAGLYPFLPGDALKIVLAALLLPAARRRLSPRSRP